MPGFASLPLRVALVAGLTAALISLVQFVLGTFLAVAASPAAAHLLYESVNRLDGVTATVSFATERAVIVAAATNLLEGRPSSLGSAWAK